MDAREVAAGLTKAARRSLKAMNITWSTVSEMSGVTGMALTLLAYQREPLVMRRWTTWGSDRANGQKRGEGYEYQLTELGLAVRAILASEEKAG